MLIDQRKTNKSCHILRVYLRKIFVPIQTQLNKFIINNLQYYYKRGFKLEIYEDSRSLINSVNIGATTKTKDKIQNEEDNDEMS